MPGVCGACTSDADCLAGETCGANGLCTGGYGGGYGYGGYGYGGYGYGGYGYGGSGYGGGGYGGGGYGGGVASCGAAGTSCAADGDCCTGYHCILGACGTCSDPSHPLYCPATNSVPADCWPANTACSTVTNCGGSLTSCTSPALTVDCATNTCTCADPSYPVYCPATGAVPEGCWSPGTVCSTVTSCYGVAHACTSAQDFYDCTTKSCLSGSTSGGCDPSWCSPTCYDGVCCTAYCDGDTCVEGGCDD